ncbi:MULTISPECIES: helix-turn-helix transcriptional regulator [Acinetobacter]|uniref:AlpA family phage regulatory protein n=2 Tax=Acinetobacter TaxID=469 RepID=N9C664_9GAMM|nr:MULTISPECIES: AlpA family phage regulatory protein [Acinetobacter]ENV80986.1 hypothetical protein F942_00137 [Acinetobacter ursingii ANC 3649]MDI3239223.1 AlpA family phage regulatory protein [Acinetobacter ursingii]MEC6127632.1 AlpA family phage regulatory protein [Acinetobacter ursingii]QXZ22396.1 AlpA family phage regulatory protein [Acinetobacter septicus]
MQQYYRMYDLATTAARSSRIYTTKDGKTRIIKGRPEHKGLLPMGESTIWEKVRSGEFPKPIRLSERVTVWRQEDIQNWIESKAKARN